ncbi:MAG: hypothetical protein JWM41_1960 [Gemmatimonadetes bacterium]|nr:hypothetical protein [Gemmatimonadota bacterium]
MKRIRVLSTALIVLAVGGSTAAHAQDRGKRPDQQDKHGQQDQHAQQDQHGQQNRVPPQEQQRRIQEEQQRNNQYRQRLDQQAQVVRQQTDQLQQEKRAAQFRAQQEYAARIQQQQRQQAQIQRDRNYANDPYVNTPHNYRYNVGGTYHQTNQYGVEVLRQAVNNGYVEGVRAGQADRQDRWPANFQNSPAYRNADYGYNGNYVDRSDYNYYFRQGFQRGYQDGYNSRSQYGSYSNGNGSILGNILSTILGLQTIR